MKRFHSRNFPWLPAAHQIELVAVDPGTPLLEPNGDARLGKVAVIDRPRRVFYSETRRVSIKRRVIDEHRIAVLQDGSAHAEAVRTLRTEVLLQMQRNDWRTLAVMSVDEGAGKSTIALNLAFGFAMELDHTALLVDADLRNPGVCDLLGIEAGRGLSDYLTGRAALKDILIHPRGSNCLTLLPGGTIVPNTSELIRSRKMANLVSELRARYSDRMIVFDMPAIHSGANALASSRDIDATILVVEERWTKPADVARTCAMLRHANLIGVVLNKSTQLRTPESGARQESGIFRRIFGARGAAGR